MHQLPETGYLRLKQIIGDQKENPPIPAIIPISKSSWYKGIREGRYPKPFLIGERMKVWKVEDIRALIEKLDVR